jgi:hypothetical protein
VRGDVFRIATWLIKFLSLLETFDACYLRISQIAQIKIGAGSRDSRIIFSARQV